MSGSTPGRARVLRGLRAVAAAQSELGRLFARDRRMHTTDAAAIVEILTAEGRGRPLTPARLAERIALTTGATSTLLNRLEGAGHIRRARDHSDRRIVTLHSTPGIHQAADDFFAPLDGRLQAVLDTYPAGDLQLVADVVDRLLASMNAYRDAIRERGTPTPSTSGPGAPGEPGE